MKQLFFLLLLISAYNVKAQQLPLTIGEAYAYEVGDTFQYRFSYYQINDGQGYSGNNVIVITGKTIVGDSTYYTYTNDVLFTWFSPPVTPTIKPVPFKWLRYSNTFVAIANLDSSVHSLYDDMLYCNPQSGLCADSTYTDSLYNGSKQTILQMYSLSPLTAKFAGGLGMVLYSDLNEVFARTETFELIYYRKANGETWGTYGIMTGINEAKNKIELNVFPNPAINQLHITSAEATDKTVSIYSVNGSQTDIVTSMNSKASIDISKLPPAIYFVQVQSNDGIGRYKFMKQ